MEEDQSKIRKKRSKDEYVKEHMESKKQFVQNLIELETVLFKIYTGKEFSKEIIDEKYQSLMKKDFKFLQERIETVSFAIEKNTKYL